MLTSYQCETVAYVTEYGDLLCPDCFENGGDFAKPVIRYSLDEFQSGTGDDWCSHRGYYDYDGEECGCEPSVNCSGCDDALLESWEDPDCPNGGGEDDD